MKHLPWNNQTHNNDVTCGIGISVAQVVTWYVCREEICGMVTVLDEMFSKSFMSILRTPNCHF